MLFMYFNVICTIAVSTLTYTQLKVDLMLLFLITVDLVLLAIFQVLLTIQQV